MNDFTCMAQAIRALSAGFECTTALDAFDVVLMKFRNVVAEGERTHKSIEFKDGSLIRFSDATDLQRQQGLDWFGIVQEKRA